MEIVGDDGSVFKVKDEGSKAAFGRGSGFNTTDRTVSRRHVLFELNQTEPRVSFQVVGKNPLWLRSGNGERTIKTFRNLEKGEIGPGDSFCISSQIPVWFNLKQIGEDWANVDISQIDPVKEFGFLVIGHEFDCYPKNRIRDPKNWDWFLEETRQEDGESDDEQKRKRRKRKKDEDDDWSDESEDMETTEQVDKVSKPKYMTRSKDKDKTKPSKSKERKKDSSRMKIDEEEEEEEDDDDDDEEDETLGGFIVKDEDEEEETENGDEEEEEEELMEDEEDEE